ncbi:MAG: LytTR family transcriptional regulator [Alistipes sp.]|nr:LytTR family transcriptional regulator [Alistipes sp.]
MNRNLLNRNVPGLIFSYRRQLGIIFWMMVAAVLFIIIFKPFNIYEKLDLQQMMEMSSFITSQQDAYWVALTTIVAIAAAVVTLSRLIMVRYKHYDNALTYRWYLMWCCVEFVFVALFITICSALMFHHGYGSALRLFFDVLGRASCILSIPYSFCILYIIIIDKSLQLKALRESIDKEEATLQKSYVLFYDDRDEMRLSVKREDVILIESADNYICVWYMNNDTVKKCMIRNTMKRLTKQFEESCIRRCHRSYMINMERVKVLRRDKDGVFIEFGIEGVFDVPISRTYISDVTSWLMK